MKIEGRDETAGCIAYTISTREGRGEGDDIQAQLVAIRLGAENAAVRIQEEWSVTHRRGRGESKLLGALGSGMPHWWGKKQERGESHTRATLPWAGVNNSHWRAANTTGCSTSNFYFASDPGKLAKPSYQAVLG